MATQTRTDLVVDRSAQGELLRINFNVSFPQVTAFAAMPCLLLLLRLLLRLLLLLLLVFSDGSVGAAAALLPLQVELGPCRC